MFLIRPEAIDGAVLLGSTAEDATPHWSGVTTYGVDAPAIGATTNRIYESVQAGNLNHNPETDDGTWWIDVGPSNPWAMFDPVVQTQTTAPDMIEVQLQLPAGRRATAVAVLNIDAASLSIVQEDATDGVVYDETFSLVSNEGISDPWSYTYEPIVRRRDFIVNDLTPYAGADLTITLHDEGGVAKCGVCIVGLPLEIGETYAGARVGITDYSIKSANELGQFSIVERAFSRNGDFTVLVDNAKADQIYNVLSGYRATPILYVGSMLYASTYQYGFFREFALELEGFSPGFSLFTLQSEGLT